MYCEVVTVAENRKQSGTKLFGVCRPVISPVACHALRLVHFARGDECAASAAHLSETTVAGFAISAGAFQFVTVS
jgi:hypothetical protein